MAAESAPSAISQRADGSTPASSSSVESCTPVHSEQLSKPWIAGTLSGCGCGAFSALAVAGAFDEGDARLHRIARQRLEREHQRPLHQAVDHQPMLVGIDVRNAGMAALEMQPGRRDHAFEQMQRRARGADALRRRIGRRGIARTTLPSNCDGWP